MIRFSFNGDYKGLSLVKLQGTDPCKAKGIQE